MPSLRPAWCLLLALPLVIACSYGDHTSHYDGGYGRNSYYTPPATQGDIESATIDVDQLLDAEPGAGAGAFIEYESGGTYHVTTSCDAGQACNWDIVVTPLDGATLRSVSAVDLESDDSVTLGSVNQARLVALTGKDFDGFTLQTDPGAAIELDALLDNGAANRYMFWVGDGALISGAPSNPVDLVPSAQ
jgi:hypothetical protein